MSDNYDKVERRKKRRPNCVHAGASIPCFAHDHGKCALLTDTGVRMPCPFYKSLKKYLDDLEKYPYRGEGSI